MDASPAAPAETWLTTDRGLYILERVLMRYDGVCLMALVVAPDGQRALALASDEDDVSLSYVVADLDDSGIRALTGDTPASGTVRALILASRHVRRLRASWDDSGVCTGTELDVDPGSLCESELPAP